VATSKPVAFAEPILDVLGLRHLFGVVAGPDLNPFGETKGDTVATALVERPGDLPAALDELTTPPFQRIRSLIGC
jgi:phosphoglycolate phosphatase-like HAD superfamily hydrolase